MNVKSPWDVPMRECALPNVDSLLGVHSPNGESQLGSFSSPIKDVVYIGDCTFPIMKSSPTSTHHLGMFTPPLLCIIQWDCPMSWCVLSGDSPM